MIQKNHQTKASREKATNLRMLHIDGTFTFNFLEMSYLFVDRESFSVWELVIIVWVVALYCFNSSERVFWLWSLGCIGFSK